MNALTQDNFLPAGEVRLDPKFIASDQAEALRAALQNALHWSQKPIRLFGREVMQPRLVTFYADSGVDYRYSGLTWHGEGWPDVLAEIKHQIEDHSGERFNSVLCNRYRDGADSMGWHADNEPELGRNPVIASLSLGGERRFMLKPRKPEHGAAVTYILTSGSLLIMAGDLQHHWLHQVPKTKRAVDERINLTFRWIQSS
jgi:alkylated DNA repair dioxygenase AlkB